MPNIRVTVNNPSPQRISVDQQTRTGVRQIGITSDATLAAGTVQSVSLATSEGLSQSGSPITVSGTITITANQASTSQTGIVRLQDSLLSLNTNQALTANMGYYLSTLIQGKVQNTVSISTGNGLAGGGDLTTNRTITANDASVTTNGVVRLNDTIVSTNTFQAATANAVNAVQRGVASANAAAAAAAQVAAAIRSGTVNSVTVAASTGLLSSGSPITDSGTITLSANDASVTVNGIVRLTDVVTSSNTYGAATPNSVNTVHRIAVFTNTLVSTVNTALYTVRSGTVNSVAVSTGTGLSSSGSPITDSGTISISANDASTTVNGVVRLNDTLSSSNTNQALTSNMGGYITQLLVGKLSNTRFINTTSPLAGGAALDTNPTITISMASRTTNGETRLEDTVTSQNVWGAATPNTVNTVHRIAVFANTLAASVNAVTFSIRSGTVNSVTVAAGTGLISSGSPITDSGTITLSANDASITVNGIVRLNDTLTSSNLNQALTANMGGYITQLMVGKVQNTDIFAGSTTRPGLVPANNAGNGMYVLTAAGTWVPPGSGGGGGGSGTVTSVSIIAGSGLSQTGSAITVSGSYTISANDASLTQNGIVRLNDTVTSSNTNQAATANMIRYLVNSLTLSNTGENLGIKYNGGYKVYARTYLANDTIQLPLVDHAGVNTGNLTPDRTYVWRVQTQATGVQFDSAIYYAYVRADGVPSLAYPHLKLNTVNTNQPEILLVDNVYRITSNHATPYVFTVVTEEWPNDTFFPASLGPVGYTPGSGLVMFSPLKDGLPIQGQGAKVWNEYNQGPDSNLHADLLDTYHANAFANAVIANSRTISTGNGLLGGGPLSGNLTITANDASISVNGIVRLNDTLTSSNLNQALTANMGGYLTQLLVGKLSNTRFINTTSPLSGGAALDTNPTIAIAMASVSTNGETRLNDTVTSQNVWGAATPNSVNTVHRIASFANALAVQANAATFSIRSGTVNSVAIAAGTGLVSSGSPITDSGTISISANDASISVNGVVRLNDTLTSANLNQALTANMGGYITQLFVGKVQNTTTVSTTSPLSGGGALSSSLTLSIAPATTTSNGETRLNDTVTSLNVHQAATPNAVNTVHRIAVFANTVAVAANAATFAIRSGTVNSVSVSAGTGLVSSGSPVTDSGTISISANDASISVNGVVRLNDTLSSANLNQALTANMGGYITQLLVGKVQNTRTISTTGGALTGGGTLAADLSLTIANATTEVNGVVRLNDTVTSSNVFGAATPNSVNTVHRIATFANTLAVAVNTAAFAIRSGTVNSVSVAAGTGLVSSGSPVTDSGSISISANDASISVNGVVRLNDTLSSANLNQALTANMGGYITQLLVGKVQNTRSISTVGGAITGGGTLASDLTLTIANASTTLNGVVRLDDTIFGVGNNFTAATANVANILARPYIGTYAGLVPANTVSNGTYFLRSDGQWVPGTGGGGGGTVLSVTILAGSGLSQTGSQITTSGTYTISANDASTSQNGVVRLQDSLASQNLGQALTANMGFYITQQLVGKVQNTRTISTTSPLTGGGDLSTDRTLAIQAATLTQNGEVRLQDSLTSPNTFQALTANMGVLITSQLVGKVQNTRTVATAGGALQGGGDLTADRTLFIANADINTNGVVRLNDTLTSSNLTQALTANMGGYITQLFVGKVQNTRSVSTVGGALTGGGTLAADLTLTVANATTEVNGVVRLNDTVTSTNTNQAATPRTVKLAYDTAAAVRSGTVNSVTIIAGSGLAQTGSAISDSGTYTISANAASISVNGVVRLNDTLTSANLGQALTANMGGYITQLLVGKVQNTTTVSTTSPLAGGGALSSSLTLSIQAAGINQNGEVRLNDTLSSANLGQALTANMGGYITQLLVGKVQNTRSVSTTGGALTGGGTLASDLTLTVANATTEVNGVVRLNDTLSSSNTNQALTANMGGYITQLFVGKVQNTRSISTVGGALTGGGTLAADLTLTIANASTTVNGVVRLNDTLLGQGNTTQAATANIANILSRAFNGTDYAGLVPANNATTNPTGNGTYVLTAAGTWVPQSGGGGGGSGTVTSVSIIAGSGLSQTGSAITTSGSYTITANDASTSVNGVVRLQDSLASANLGQALTANMGAYITQLLVGKVQNTTTVSTTSPLAGGGALSSSLTLSIQAAGINQNGEVRLNDTLSSANLGQALTANMGGYITQLFVGKVQNTRSVSTVGGALTGGGTLAADLTLTVANATTEVNGVVRLNDTVASLNLNQALTANMGRYIVQSLLPGKVQNTFSISTTSPLTGGGDLTTNRTIAIQAAGINQNGEVRLNDTLSSANLGQALTANMGGYITQLLVGKVQNTVSISTVGGALTGGGTLATSLSLTIANATPEVNGVVRLNDTLLSTNTNQALTANQGRALARIFSATYDGLVPTPGASTGRLLRDDATWVTVSGTGTVTSVDITPTEGILSTGGPITGAGAITIGANNFTATANGFVPKSVTADGTKYLRDDGTWQTVSASSGSSDFDYGMAIAVNRGYFL